MPSANVVATLYIGDWPWPLLVTAVLTIVMLVAILTECLVFRPLRRADATTLLVASFAVSFVLQFAIFLVYGGRPKAVNVGATLNEQILLLGVRVPVLDLLPIGTTAFLVVGLTLFLRKTRFGIEIRAASEDFQMARLLGVRASTVILIAFAISGILAGVVSLLYLSRTGIVAPRMGIPLVLVAFVATVIGGKASLAQRSATLWSGP